jgi:hypothetical protein
MTIDEAAQKLEEAGLFARCINGTEKRITGGCQKVIYDGIELYQKLFSIIPHETGWLLMLPYEGQVDTEIQVSNISEAIQLIRRKYSTELERS